MEHKYRGPCCTSVPSGAYTGAPPLLYYMYHPSGALNLLEAVPHILLATAVHVGGGHGKLAPVSEL